jgi:hypothetical protein
MNEEQSKKALELLAKSNELLTKCISLLERQVALFEKYDAEAFFDEEELRQNLLNAPRSRRP